MSEEDLLKQFAALQEMYTPEELDPELVPFVYDGPVGRALHHKFIIDIMYNEISNKRINQFYRYRKEEVEKAYKQADWGRFVFLHERPYRFDALMDIMDESLLHETGGKSFWELVGSIWTDSENIHENLEDWINLWSSNFEGRENVMDDDDRSTLQAMPERLAVWRGGGHKNISEGLSWTLKEEKAIWFANRYSHDSRHPHIASGWVNKSDVLAYFSGRNEEEIVVLPENVQNLKIKKLKKIRKKK